MRLIRFLFHRPRTSTHCIPNSRDATKQARSKSCEISSVITATRKGEDHAGVLASSAAKIFGTLRQATSSHQCTGANQKIASRPTWHHRTPETSSTDVPDCHSVSKPLRKYGGSVCESNAPLTSKMPIAGFEDRESHRTPFASASGFTTAAIVNSRSYGRWRITLARHNSFAEFLIDCPGSPVYGQSHVLICSARRIHQPSPRG